MGFISYFKTDVKTVPKFIAIPDTEKFPGALPGILGNKNPADSEQNSLRPPSSRATRESRLVDDIKHQVVVNHIFQAQCGALWIRDVSKEKEGVMVRKQRHQYLFKPPGLENSPFAQAMIMLNVQVLFLLQSYFQDTTNSRHRPP